MTGTGDEDGEEGEEGGETTAQLFFRFLLDVEDEIDAIPPWQHAKVLHRILTSPVAGRPEENWCGCRLYRDDRTRSLTCECGHHFDLHEEQRRCWTMVVPL